MKYLHFRNETLNHVRAIDDLVTQVVTLRKEPLKFIVNAIFSRESIIVSGNVDTYSFILFLLIFNNRSKIIVHMSSAKTTFLHTLALSLLAKKKLVRFAFVTKLVSERFESLMAGDKNKYSIVYHYSNIFAWSGIRAEKTVENDFLFFGRLDSRRGIEEFILLAEQNSEFSFVIAGDGPMRPLVEERCSLINNLRYLGFVDESRKRQLLSSCRCLVSLMRETENFGISIAEALFLDMVVICPDDYGPREIVGKSFKGYDKKLLKKDLFDAANFSRSVLFGEKFQNSGIAIDMSRDNVRRQWLRLLDG